MCVCSVTQSRPIFATARLLCPWGFSSQECWNGLPFPPPGDIPDPGIQPTPPSALAGGFFTTEPPGKQCLLHSKYVLPT